MEKNNIEFIITDDKVILEIDKKFLFDVLTKNSNDCCCKEEENNVTNNEDDKMQNEIMNLINSIRNELEKK